jgi:biotin transport system substrate-specific component
MQLTNRAVLADVLYPRDWSKTREARIAKEAVLIVGFAAFVALCAQIAVRLPWTTVPITGQTFAVLVTGGALGAWRGAASLGVYMLAGMLGLGVFAPGESALGMTGSWDVHFIFPWEGTHKLIWDISSGGYIVGFIFAAFAVGWFAERRWDRGPWGIVAMLAGSVLVYVPGILWLYYLVATDWVTAGKPLGDWLAGSGDWDKTLKGGLYPFIVGDMMKLYMAAVTLPLVWKLVERFRKDSG